MILIDGSTGEGGGQVLRTALTLSMMTSQPITIKNIRSGRDKPGIRPQHLVAIEASTKISNGLVEGAAIGSPSISFFPREIESGNYKFDIRTAGASSLVLQTIFIPLSFTGSQSKINIVGGTHVPWSPCFHYLSWHWLSFIKEIGFNATLSMGQAGYFPSGGGEINAEISPVTKLSGLNLQERGLMLQIRGISAASNLPRKIAERQRNRVIQRLGSKYPLNDIRIANFPSRNKGTFLILIVEFENSQACFVGLGALGKPSERVADDAIDPLENFISTDGVVDPFLADQLLLPSVFTNSRSIYRTSSVTQHLLTNSAVIKKFLPVEIMVDGDLGEPGTIIIQN